jgi:ribonuclease R
MEGLLHGDRVRARLVPGRDGKLRALVVAVLGEDPVLVGTVQRWRTGFVVEVSEAPGDIPVTLEEGAPLPTPGMAYEVEVTDRAGRRRARLKRLLGRPGDLPVELSRILCGARVRADFPPEALREAAEASDDVEEAARLDPARQDLTALPLCTLDNETARDFDDAVFVRRMGRGFELTVAIADVAHYVPEGSALDVEAVARGTSTYLPDRVIPMLPPRLSDDLCSLKPQAPRLAMATRIRFGPGGDPREVEHFPALIRSVARLTYAQVAAAMDRGAFRLEGAPGFDLPAAVALFQALKAARKGRGALDLDLPELTVELAPDGEPTRLEPLARHDAHRLIEEFMVATNEAVARTLGQAMVPCLYRVHDPPDPAKLQVFRVLAQAHALERSLPPDPSPVALARFVDALRDHPSATVLQTALLRSLMQARYQVENTGHFGLASDAYLHFTSPIRRYPDLVNHRRLKALLSTPSRRRSGPGPVAVPLALQELARQCTVNERRAMELERSVDALYATRVCQGRVGEVLPGTVTACAEPGLFVQLDTVLVEGLVPMADLAEDGAQLDLHATMIRCRRSGRTLRAGDRVDVRVVSANLSRRQVTLHLETGPGPGTGGVNKQAARARR